MELQSHFVSNSQIFINLTSNVNTQFDKLCEIIINNDVCDIGLPDNSRLQLHIKSKQFDSQKLMFTLEFKESGFLFVFNSKLFLNLAEYKNIACEFRLKNYIEPTFAEKVTNSIESEFQRNLDMYGELGARCIANNEVLPGVPFGVVTTVFGHWKDIVLKKANNEKTEVALLFYEDKYVILENAHVVLVKSFI